MTDERVFEEQFYSHYSWCLNPPLSTGDLLHRFREEIDRYEGLAGWQQEESKVNLYLFACAVACTADDYFAMHWLTLSPLSHRFPQLRMSIDAVQTFVGLSRSIVNVDDHAAWQWRRRWDTCVELACRLLLCDATSEIDAFRRLETVASELTRARLPRALLKRRMRLPEAFRSQDMAHHDVITLIRRFCESSPGTDRPLVIMGLRTAGGYFAPLMAEYLRMQGWSQVRWFSIRPKCGISYWEKLQLRRIAKQNARLLVVDDYPATGTTLRRTLEILGRLGINKEHIVVLAPTHAAQPDWIRSAGIDGQIEVVTIDLADLHKNAVLVPSAVETLCASYYSGSDWVGARVMQDESIDALNARLAEHSRDGHHVREKRVFAIELSKRSGETATRKVFFKSVGWGWLGYHAYIAGVRLQGFVPNVIGLRNGLLVTEWIDHEPGTPPVESTDGIVNVLASYVAARSRRLRLTGDCRFESRTYRWTGSDEILTILRSAYGPYLNRLKIPALRKELHKYVMAAPTLVDGKMQPEEWIQTCGRTYKVDFEHHNFGGPEPDIVDPAYDLAAAIYEFGMTAEAEQQFLRAYCLESGDTSIEERILLHKIFYGSMVMKHSLDHIIHGKEPQANNARYHAARNFLVYSMNGFCSKLVQAIRPYQWSDSLFFMDLDGVFDQELLGFPHATQSGLESLALLRLNGFSVVINTGRSIQHVRQYCDAYGLCGGIAEFGAVFLDAIGRREIPLIDKAGMQQLARCRDEIGKLPGVFIDPGYEYSIRAYRYNGRATIEIPAIEIKELLSGPEFSHLTCICRGSDSYIVQKQTGKGVALRFVRQQVGSAATPVTAVGDSNYDIGMLKSAEFAYAPANCSPALRDLARQGQCRILNKRFQNGLMAAVQDRLRHTGATVCEPPNSPIGTDRDQLDGLMQMVLKAADRQMVLQILAILTWWNL